MALADSGGNGPLLAPLLAELAAVRATGSPVRIVGADSKAAWWRTQATHVLSLQPYAGIVSYEPSELVVTARAGTPLEEIERVLASHRQCLAAEPPRLAPGSTLGGVVAAGLSGPGRPWHGALRDHVLGIKLLSAHGEILRFGGQVMKNVAGYDVSRLCVGAWGRLGPILEISLRVAPAPEHSVTAVWELPEAEALQRMTTLGAAPHPVSGCLYLSPHLFLRLAGSSAAVDAALSRLRPDRVQAATSLWEDWRDCRHPFLRRPGLWRVSVPPAAPPLGGYGECAIDWGGALRWIAGEREPAGLASTVTAMGGSMRRWRQPTFAALPSGNLGALSRRVLASFDPDHCFNPEVD